jgi:acetyltransferase-like isoleucine patch superfamily enzyme
LGDSTALAEGVEIDTHKHSEYDHSERSYGKVTIKDFAAIYAHATIPPGVTIGKQAIVAAKALVSNDVPANIVVAGVPAKVVRAKDTNGRKQEQLNHIWLYNGAFQK